MKTIHQLTILLGLVASLSLNTVNAHSFNIVFIAPFNEIAGQSALNGFLFAAREQDSHEFEESDGHLGGLDSYVFKVDSTASLGQLETTIRESAPLFAVANSLTSVIREMLEAHQVVVVDPVASKFWAAATADADQIRLMNGDSFSIAYEQAYGYTPDLNVLRGYLAARVIANVVRSSNGPARFGASKLKQAVDQALQSSLW